MASCKANISAVIPRLVKLLQNLCAPVNDGKNFQNISFGTVLFAVYVTIRYAQHTRPNEFIIIMNHTVNIHDSYCEMYTLLINFTFRPQASLANLQVPPS